MKAHPFSRPAGRPLCSCARATRSGAQSQAAKQTLAALPYLGKVSIRGRFRGSAATHRRVLSQRECGERVCQTLPAGVDGLWGVRGRVKAGGEGRGRRAGPRRRRQGSSRARIQYGGGGLALPGPAWSPDPPQDGRPHARLDGANVRD
ncbi:hypothetical protein E2C01_035965 [Portunus trituberculatus]|uniref:Uncharacterized protein n=1 Tax=Portunus trituberculatus TaxID=210409 RepID=A0A5B7F9T4_PORTR|nr:hypothetical protein [Portunus trituberculatus]